MGLNRTAEEPHDAGHLVGRGLDFATPLFDGGVRPLDASGQVDQLNAVLAANGSKGACISHAPFSTILWNLSQGGSMLAGAQRTHTLGLPISTTTRYISGMAKRGRPTESPKGQFPNRISLFRQRKGLTQDQVCEEAGIPLSTYKKMESGNHGVKPDKLAKLAEIFGCGQWELMPDAPDVSKEELETIRAIMRMTPEQREQFTAICRATFALAGVEAPDLPQS